MRGKRKNILLFLLVFIGFPTESFNGNEEAYQFIPSDFFTPVNQRLDNDASSFEYSSFIENQVVRFMEYNGLHGVSLAIVKYEKLVYARAFCYSDIENQILASPDNLFRVASVSKLLTAVAVMQLVEEGVLDLDGKVFGANGYLDNPEYQNFKDPRIGQITIRHLLAHTSGFSNRYGDPMFLPHLVAEKTGAGLPLGINDYIVFALDRRLHFQPGLGYGYSNMGYAFLGEIIARETGLPYEEYVKFNLLNKLGISDMHIGKNSLEERLDNEVKYYENGGFSMVPSFDGTDSLAAKPYGGNNIELLGAAGGWIASAPELARLMVSIDGFQKVKDVLSPKSIQEMTLEGDRPLGWMDTDENGIWSRTGNFAGSSAMLYRRPDGFQWVFLSNTSSWKGHLLSSDIKRLMNRIVDRVEDWPDRDLFYFSGKDKLLTLNR